MYIATSLLYFCLFLASSYILPASSLKLPRKQQTITPISQIQSQYVTSPLDAKVVTVEGVVTAVRHSNKETDLFRGSFYLQSRTSEWDQDIRTSEGIFVYLGDSQGSSSRQKVIAGSISIGDRVRIHDATVKEFRFKDELLSITQLVQVKSIEVIARSPFNFSSIFPRLDRVAAKMLPGDISVKENTNKSAMVERALQKMGITPIVLNGCVNAQVSEDVAPAIAQAAPQPSAPVAPKSTSFFSSLFRFFLGGSTNDAEEEHNQQQQDQTNTAEPMVVDVPRKRKLVQREFCYRMPTQHCFVPNPFDLNVPKFNVEDRDTKVMKSLSGSNYSRLLEPEKTGLHFYESLEHMIVKIEAPMAIAKKDRWGNVYVVSHEGKYATGRSSRGVLVQHAYDKKDGQLLIDSNPERILISPPMDGSFNPDITVGDRLTTIYGVVDYSFGLYRVTPFTRLQVVKSLQTEIARPTRLTSAKSRPASSIDTTMSNSDSNSLSSGSTPSADCTPITILSYNLENLSARDTDRITRLADQIVTHLRQPDILALQEVMGNDGSDPKARNVDASLTMQRIVKAISSHSRGAVKYEFTQINPHMSDADGGKPFGNIRTVYLYNPQKVRLAASATGRIGFPLESIRVVASENRTLGSSTRNRMSPEPRQWTFNVNPGRIDPFSPAFTRTRKPLVALFETVDTKKRITVINLHLSSKFGGSSLYGAMQPPLNGGVLKRDTQVEVVTNFVQELRRYDPYARVVVVGDMNEYEFVQPMLRLAKEFVELATHVMPAEERYDYVFDGNGQLLDHIFVTPNLADRAEMEIVHLNTWVPYKRALSDHDPVLAKIEVCPVSMHGRVAAATDFDDLIVPPPMNAPIGSKDDVIESDDDEMEIDGDYLDDDEEDDSLAEDMDWDKRPSTRRATRMRQQSEARRIRKASGTKRTNPETSVETEPTEVTNKRAKPEKQRKPLKGKQSKKAPVREDSPDPQIPPQPVSQRPQRAQRQRPVYAEPASSEESSTPEPEDVEVKSFDAEPQSSQTPEPAEQVMTKKKSQLRPPSLRVINKQLGKMTRRRKAPVRYDPSLYI